MIYLNIIGLIFDIIGVAGLYFFGVPNKDLSKGVMAFQDYNDKKENRYRIYSEVSFWLIVLGFILQLTYSICSILSKT